MSIMWQIVRRITHKILGVKGLRLLSYAKSRYYGKKRSRKDALKKGKHYTSVSEERFSSRLFCLP